MRLPEFLFACLGNPWIWLVAVLGLTALLSWLIALSRLPLTWAYPLTSLSFVVVLAGGILLFGESPTWPKVIATGCIILGVGILGLSKVG